MKMKKKKLTAAERRRGKDRRGKGAVAVIYERLVARKVLPERRKNDRRKD